mmetsp:Transcript_23169/g.48062  ORF Transcript_23169/g.48062 Transcript_23169/m.48062 type:complete len:250 (+) Transcript_23169:372-1121(+)
MMTNKTILALIALLTINLPSTTSWTSTLSSIPSLSFTQLHHLPNQQTRKNIRQRPLIVHNNNRWRSGHFTLGCKRKDDEEEDKGKEGKDNMGVNGGSGGGGGFGKKSPPSTFRPIPTSPQLEVRSSSPPNPPKPTKNNPRETNDITKLEVDDKGYTLYTDPDTGEKNRVFDSLVTYPSSFDIKVVGPNTPSFISSIKSSVSTLAPIQSSKERVLGKWVSITMTVVVESSEVLYEVYRVVDEDERVKFKF